MPPTQSVVTYRFAHVRTYVRTTIVCVQLLYTNKRIVTKYAQMVDLNV